MKDPITLALLVASAALACTFAGCLFGQHAPYCYMGVRPGWNPLPRVAAARPPRLLALRQSVWMGRCCPGLKADE